MKIVHGRMDQDNLDSLISCTSMRLLINNSSLQKLNS